MAEKEVPEGLDDLGRDILDTDRIIIEKKRAAFSRVVTFIDAEFALTDLASDFATAQTEINTAQSDIDTLETRATGLELIAAQTYVVTGASATVSAGTTDVLILTAGAVALQMQTVVDTGRVRIHTHSGTGAVTLSRSAVDAAASGVFQSATGTANTCVLSAPNAFRQGRTWSLTPKIQGVPTWYVHDGESLSVDNLATTVAGHTSSLATDAAAILALQKGIVPAANFRNTTSGTTATILAGETLVRQGSANAMVYTMPAATAGYEIDIVKDTTNAGTITIARAGSDTIHGSASNYVLDESGYVTTATTFRKRWTISCLVAGEWTVT